MVWSGTSATPATAGNPPSFVLVETALGVLGLAWSQDGLTRLQLPEADSDAVATRLARDADLACVAALPDFVAAAVSSLEDYANGKRVDFRSLRLDLARSSPFEQAVYRHALGIGYGQTTTYGEIARALGDVGHSRAVGQALGRNPLAIIVPCHRVVAAGGKPGGFSAFGGRLTKARLLELEGSCLPGHGPTLPGLELPIMTRAAPRRGR